MKIFWTHKNEVVDMPYMVQAAVPAVRLLLHHSPQQRVEITLKGNRAFLVPLCELDWSHESLLKENIETSPAWLGTNTDRAHLERLGKR